MSLSPSLFQYVPNPPLRRYNTDIVVISTFHPAPFPHDFSNLLTAPTLFRFINSQPPGPQSRSRTLPFQAPFQLRGPWSGILSRLCMNLFPFFFFFYLPTWSFSSLSRMFLNIPPQFFKTENSPNPFFTCFSPSGRASSRSQTPLDPQR